jgi:AraC-like DNA-binding protein
MLRLAGDVESRGEAAGGFLDRHQYHAWQRIKPAIRHMLLYLDQPLRVPALRVVAGLSGSRFFALFKFATGWTPIHFFIRLRIQFACELLRNKNLRVKEIAGLLGYNDPLYFSRVFNSVTGMAPSRFRRGTYVAPPGMSSKLSHGGRIEGRLDWVSLEESNSILGQPLQSLKAPGEWGWQTNRQRNQRVLRPSITRLKMCAKAI